MVMLSNYLMLKINLYVDKWLMWLVLYLMGPFFVHTLVHVRYQVNNKQQDHLLMKQIHMVVHQRLSSQQIVVKYLKEIQTNRFIRVNFRIIIYLMIMILYVEHQVLVIDISKQIFVSKDQLHRGYFVHLGCLMVLYPNKLYCVVIDIF